MAHRAAVARLLSITLLLAGGCVTTSQPQGNHPPTTQPAADTDPQAARGLERDLISLQQARTEGLLTPDEYQLAVDRAMNDPIGWYQTTHDGLFQPLNATRLHAELAYLARMKNQGTLTSAQFQAARKVFTELYVPQPPAPDSAGVPGSSVSQPDGHEAKLLEEQLIALKASLADGVLTQTEYQQGLYQAITRSSPQPIGLSELNAEVKYLTGMKERGTLTQEQFDWLRQMWMHRFVTQNTPTSLPAD